MEKKTGPGKTEKRISPPSLMLYNFNIDGQALKDEHKRFLRAEAFATLNGGGSVTIIGLTDRSGSTSYNQALSERRVAATIAFLRSEVSKSFNVKQGTGFGEAAAAREGESDGSSDERFRAVLVYLWKTPFPQTVATVQTATVNVTLKSFIAVVGSNTGTMEGYVTTPAIPPFPSVSVDRQSLLDALAKATDLNFSENPVVIAKDKRYRLFSSCNFNLSWSNGELISATASPLDTDVGKEGPFQPPDMIATPVTINRAGPSIFTFFWSGRGRPNLAVEPTFQAVRLRTSVYIWHTIHGQISVSSGTPVVSGKLDGSAFPSHRCFVNGSMVVSPSDLTQGPFTNLWTPDASDPSKVK